MFTPRVSPKVDHLKRITLADVALDTLGYNGHTTSSDMLWAGVPFITVRGDNWPSRVATSIAEASQVKGMVVENLTEYENMRIFTLPK